MTNLAASLQAILLRSAGMFGQLLPYVLVGAFFGALLRRVDRVPFLDSLRSRNPWVVLLTACGLGTVSPLCTMGTVPFLAGLLGRGIPTAAVIGFLVSSSMVNPQILVLTVGTVGVPLALARWAAAVAVGISVGWLAHLAEKYRWTVISPGAARLHRHRPGRDRIFLQVYLDQLEFVAIHLVVGVLLAAAVGVLVPPNFLVRWLGPENPFAVAISSLLAIPFYVCGGGILPTMQVLMEKGVPAGVVLAFFISGPATRIQALSALGAFLSARALVLYVLIVLVWALALGLVANLAGLPG